MRSILTDIKTGEKTCKNKNVSDSVETMRKRIRGGRDEMTRQWEVTEGKYVKNGYSILK